MAGAFDLFRPWVFEDEIQRDQPEARGDGRSCLLTTRVTRALVANVRRTPEICIFSGNRDGVSVLVQKTPPPIGPIAGGIEPARPLRPNGNYTTEGLSSGRLE